MKKQKRQFWAELLARGIFVDIPKQKKQSVVEKTDSVEEPEETESKEYHLPVGVETAFEKAVEKGFKGNFEDWVKSPKFDMVEFNVKEYQMRFVNKNGEVVMDKTYTPFTSIGEDKKAVKAMKQIGKVLLQPFKKLGQGEQGNELKGEPSKYLAIDSGE